MLEVETMINTVKDATTCPGVLGTWKKEQQRPTSISITHQTAALVPSRDGWAALPLDILVQILHHVPPKDRFQHCSLVNSDWAAACVESTDSISLPGRCYNLGNLQAWMVQHGSRLTTISVAGVLGNQEVTLLPCANLRQLDLADVTVQLSRVTGGLFPGILKEATRLTRLTLQHAAVVGGPDALTAVTVLTSLQHLSLSDLDSKQASSMGLLPFLHHAQPQPLAQAPSDWFPVPGELLLHLVHLTHLQLERCVASSTLQHLSALTKLQTLLLGRLCLHHTSAAALSGLDALAKTLQWLALEGLESHISTSSVPALGNLTALTQLQLHDCKGFQPILLSGMLRLQVLELQGTPLLGTGVVVPPPGGGGGGGAGGGVGGGAAAGAGAGGNAAAAAGPLAAAAPPPPPNEDDEQAVAHAAAQAAAGAAALLIELPKLQQLRRLCLVQVLWAHAAGQPSSAYAALTAAGSNLTHLDLSFSLIPSSAWRQIFNPGGLQTLAALTSLNITCSQALIGDDTLGFIVQCCPGLKHLGLKGSMEVGLNLSALTAGPGLCGESLTSLSLNHVGSEEALANLADLRGLQDLHISVLSSVRASDLLQLTQLRGLTRLRIESSPETWIAKYGLLLFLNEAPVGAPPTVWLQLQRWCLYAIAAAAPQVVETAQEVEEKTGSRRGSSSSRRQGGGSRGRKEKDEEGGCLMRLLLRCVGV